MAVTKLKIKNLIKMGDLLCASFNLEEAHGVMGQEMARLFPAGAYYRYDHVKHLLDAAVSWGDGPPETVFARDDCFAVRRNRPHLVAGMKKGIPCPHISERMEDRSSICVPMNVHGVFLGLMHILFPYPASASSRLEKERLGAVEQLALIATRQISLALRNLQLREELSSLSTIDALTGLINRGHLEEKLNRELKKAQREEKPLGIIFIDIDHLGQFNRMFGLEAGERIIQDLGHFLGEQIRETEIACRWGADEFALIMPGLTLAATQRRAENLRELLKDHAAQDDHKQMRRVTLSIGVASLPDHGATAGDLLQSARSAVKIAKSEGRDRVRVAD
jgi:diguanylate cyclase (GGDEF)-like protein